MNFQNGGGVSQLSLDEAVLKQWLGKTERCVDVIDARQARMLQVTLDREASLQEGDPLPGLWHWVYFPETVPLSSLGREGHPKLGGFMPPVALPRRMWAGGRFTFHKPLIIGERVTKVSTINNVAVKSGRSGTLCFVTVQHELCVDGECRFTEQQDIVYREDPVPGAVQAPPLAIPENPEWTREHSPDPIQLFRYSALTFNGHRIHYDKDYCRDIEGYPGLVFHGPLSGTLLFELAVQANPANMISHYSFRAVSPLFDTASIVFSGKWEGEKMVLWANAVDGGVGVLAEARFF